MQLSVLLSVQCAVECAVFPRALACPSLVMAWLARMRDWSGEGGRLYGGGSWELNKKSNIQVRYFVSVVVFT